MQYITANNTEYGCSNILTYTDGISFITTGDILELVDSFKGITEFSISGEDKVTYSYYSNLSFKSATVDSESNITINMNLATDIEKKIIQLTASIEAQKQVIDELLSTVKSSS